MMPHAIAGRVKRVATAMARNIVRTSPTPREPRLASQAAANGKVAANAAKIKADQIYPFMILFRSGLLPMASPLPRPAPHSGLNRSISMPARKTPCSLQPGPFLFGGRLGHGFELFSAVLHDSPCGRMTHLFHRHARFVGLIRQCLALRSLSSLATVGAVSAASAQ
jgi:hypothetical protein